MSKFVLKVLKNCKNPLKTGQNHSKSFKMINPVYSAHPKRYENGMEYRRCGNSGIVLPAVSLGLWHNFGDVDTLAISRDKIIYAFDHGITHFDLANNYGPSFGSAEETFGQIYQKDLRSYRAEMIISTKAGHSMWPGPYGDGSSRKNLITSIDQSLRRMNLEYVDIFYSHRYDPDTPLDETLQALVDIVRQGKALYIGISKYPPHLAQYAYDYLASRDVPCLIYQGRYNILDRQPRNEGILHDAAERGIGFIAFSPLAQGLLTNRYIDGIPSDSRVARGGYLKKESLSPEMLQTIRQLNQFAASRGQSLARMALSWLLSQSDVTSVLVGASSVNQLADSIKAVHDPQLTDEELRAIDAIVM